MKAAWDWHLPVETEAQQREIVEFASDLGFDTLIVRDPSEAMARRGAELDVKIVAIVYARPSDAFARAHPECLQRLLPAEDEIARAGHEGTPANFQLLSHRWFSIVQDGPTLCFEHEASRSFLKERVSMCARNRGRRCVRRVRFQEPLCVFLRSMRRHPEDDG